MSSTARASEATVLANIAARASFDLAASPDKRLSLSPTAAGSMPQDGQVTALVIWILGRGPRWPSCPQDGHPLAILGRRPLSARRKDLGRACRAFLPKTAKTATPSVPRPWVIAAASARQKHELSSRIWTTDYWLLTIGCGVCTF